MDFLHSINQCIGLTLSNSRCKAVRLIACFKVDFTWLITSGFPLGRNESQIIKIRGGKDSMTERKHKNVTCKFQLAGIKNNCGSACQAPKDEGGNKTSSSGPACKPELKECATFMIDKYLNHGQAPGKPPKNKPRNAKQSTPIESRGNLHANASSRPFPFQSSGQRLEHRAFLLHPILACCSFLVLPARSAEREAPAMHVVGSEFCVVHREFRRKE